VHGGESFEGASLWSTAGFVSARIRSARL
jgi:hypothetical protein